MAQFDPTKYETVADRIKHFREKYPEGAIIVNLLSDPAQFEQVVCRAEIYLDRNDARPIAADIASEYRGASFKDGANFTAWHENCATGAIGRALDAAGFSKAKEGGRASREEIEKVNRHANAPTSHAQTPNAAPLSVVQGGELSAWERFVDKAAFYEFRAKESAAYLKLLYALIGKPEQLNDEAYQKAFDANDLEWQTAVEAVNAKLHGRTAEAIAK